VKNAKNLSQESFLRGKTVKMTISKLKERTKVEIIESVRDAFPDEIVRWWISDMCATKLAKREFLFCVESKKLTDITKISKKSRWMLEKHSTFSFRLKQENEILDDYASMLGEEDVDKVAEKFWAYGVEDIFTDYQEDFENVLDVALEKPLHDFVEKAFCLLDVIF
jgi:hypothetical protein